MSTRSRRVVAAIATVIGPDEIQFWLGLLLVGGGLWFVWRPAAFVVPGLVLIWSALPSRAPFIARPVVDDNVKRKRA